MRLPGPGAQVERSYPSSRPPDFTPPQVESLPGFTGLIAPPLQPPNIWQKFGNRPRPDTARHSRTKRAAGEPKRVESAKKKGLTSL